MQPSVTQLAPGPEKALSSYIMEVITKNFSEYVQSDVVPGSPGVPVPSVLEKFAGSKHVTPLWTPFQYFS